MAQSTFYTLPCASIDYVTPTANYANTCHVGVVLFGASKSTLRRALSSFDVFGAAAEGRPLRAGDTLSAAELLFEIGGVVPPSGWACRVDRVTRANWDYLAATWNNYRTSTAWTSGGGDVGTPPASLGYSAPATSGPFTLAGVLAFVTDAVANRAGLVNLLHRAIDENPAETQDWAAFAGPTDSTRPRLRVTYTAADPLPVAERADDAGAAHGAPAARAERAATPTPPARASRAARR
jgi:hypothetical protein